MGRRRGGKRHGGPWYGDERQRLLFERGTRQLVRGVTAREARRYTLTVPVPHYEAQAVEILFEGGSRSPKVSADGPTESPHRYSATELCLWYPGDPLDQRWVFQDGLLALLGIVTRHLFCEAWWREMGEWLGPEAPHGSVTIGGARA